jgi:LacI family transcriptional regulator
MLSALMAYRSRKQNKGFQGTLAWLTNYPTRDGWREFQNIDYFLGASRRAGELGYSLDEIWMRGVSPARLSQILLSRNVRGILLPTQPRARARLALDWDKFSAIRYGTTVFWPPLRIADSDHFRGMSLLMRQLKKHGYVSPGLACSRVTHESIDRRWVAAFLTFQSPKEHRQVPPLMENALTFPTFKRWFLEHQPDVVIATDEAIAGWLAKLGLDVPGDVGFALAARHDKNSHCAGLDECSELVGETGVEVLVDMINRGERGLPTSPTSTLVPGIWVEGNTIRRVNLPIKTPGRRKKLRHASAQCTSVQA